MQVERSIGRETKKGKEEKTNMGSCSCAVLVTILSVVGVLFLAEAELANDYYKHSCPSVESIVRSEVLKFSLTDVSAPAAFIRLLFHDCQVKGCDASIMLDSKGLGGDSEMVSQKNFGIRKLETISHIKSVLDKECPGKVSCADIIALAARESVYVSGGPEIRIPLGRKDALTGTSREADSKLPGAGIAVDELLQIFGSYGMNIEESVSILGAHTVGVGHCVNIVERLYGREESADMDLIFKELLRLNCPTRIPLTNITVFPNDLTPLAFDNHYYNNILMGHGLFGIDSGISRDPRTMKFVKHFASDQNHFFHVFASAFVKLSSTKVLSGKQGEVRKNCNHRN